MIAEQTLYTVSDLAVMHNLSRRTILRLYESEPGIQVLDRPESFRKRRYRTLRVPVYVHQRVKAKLEGTIPTTVAPTPRSPIERKQLLMRKRNATACVTPPVSKSVR